MKRAGQAAVVGLALGALAGLGGAAAAALRAALPQEGGRLRLPGLRAEVEVLRDHWGVPHISAHSSADLLLAQGYVHAQDRLWQMEFQRRLGWGRLAELLGPAALPADRALRVLGLGRLAQREAALLDGAGRAAAEAYVRGVNACIERLGWRLPLEFRLLLAPPAPWSVEDVLVVGRLLALQQAEGWAFELLRASLVDAAGATRAAALDPRNAAEGPLTVPAGVAEGGYRFAAALLQTLTALPFLGGAGGSAWAISGAHSASGRPLLASDLHTTLHMPALWYENHLTGGDLRVSGASMPGMPGVLIGHNQRIAWGMAAAPCDVQDLYIERFDPHDPARYQFRDGWEQAEVIPETIGVRGQAKPFIETVRITRHGPLVSPLAPAAQHGQHDRRPASPGSASSAEPWVEELALRWTALEPGQLIDAVLGLNRANDWPSFRAALAGWAAPAMHVVYADADGHIGAALAGATPLRAAGDGRLPVPGWTGTYEWAGTLPPDQRPQLFDPPSGVVVVAGGQIGDAGERRPIPAEWHNGYREARIHSLLGLSRRHTRHSFAQIQNDRLSLPGLELAALAGRLPARTDTQRAARAELAAWDGRMDRDSAGAAIYARLRGHLLALAYHHATGALELPDAQLAGGPPATSDQHLTPSPEAATHRRARRGPVALPSGSALVYAQGLARIGWPAEQYLARGLAELLRRLGQRDPGGLAASQPWDGLLAEAWERAIAELLVEGGAKVQGWRYGRSHRLLLRHPLGVTPALARLLNRGPFPSCGGSDTIGALHLLERPGDTDAWAGPSYRQICDLADWDNSESIHAGGQSGHPASRHYDDFVQPWLKGRYHPMLWTRDTIEEAAAARLTLAPA